LLKKGARQHVLTTSRGDDPLFGYGGIGARPGDGAPGDRRRPPGGGRAGLRHPGPGPGGGRGRPRRGAHPLHPQLRRPGTPGGDIRPLRRKVRRHRRALPDRRLLRDLPGDDASLLGASGGGGRGDHLRPRLRLLPELHPVFRRRPRAGAGRRGRRLSAQPRGCKIPDHR